MGKEGKIVSTRVGNRKYYTVDYFLFSHESYSSKTKKLKMLGVAVKKVAVCYVTNKITKWNYLWQSSVISEERMVKITELKAFL